MLLYIYSQHIQSLLYTYGQCDFIRTRKMKTTHLVNYIDLLLEQKMLDNAEKVIIEYITEYSNSYELQQRLGDVLLLKKDFDGAEKAFQQAIILKPTWAKPHCGLGRVLMEQKDIDGAKKSFQQAIILNPTWAKPLYAFGIILMAQKDLDGAEQALQQVITLKPTFVLAYKYMIKVLRMKNMLNSAAPGSAIALTSANGTGKQSIKKRQLSASSRLHSTPKKVKPYISSLDKLATICEEAAYTE